MNPKICEENGDLLFYNELFIADVFGLLDDAGAPVVAVGLLDVSQFLF
jgi:hypothetical protein